MLNSIQNSEFDFFKFGIRIRIRIRIIKIYEFAFEFIFFMNSHSANSNSLQTNANIRIRIQYSCTFVIFSHKFEANVENFLKVARLSDYLQCALGALLRALISHICLNFFAIFFKKQGIIRILSGETYHN